MDIKKKKWGYLILGAAIVSLVIVLHMYVMNMVCEKNQELWCATHTLKLFKLQIIPTITGFVFAIYVIKRKS